MNVDRSNLYDVAIRMLCISPQVVAMLLNYIIIISVDANENKQSSR